MCKAAKSEESPKSQQRSVTPRASVLRAPSLKECKVMLSVHELERRVNKLVTATVLVLSVPALLALGSGAAQAAYSVTWTEQANAGALPGTAQLVTGTGEIDAIEGHLSNTNDKDMYAICLVGNKTFSATTVNAATASDTQLFLFNAWGRGMYANDDSAYTVQSTLPAGHRLTPQTQGKYYLAISSFNNDPVSAGGRIFPNDRYFSRVVGPTGPGGGGRVSSWTNEGGSAGAYSILLTGARVCSTSSA